MVRFGARTCIFAITYSNTLCVYIDVKDGIDKPKAARIIEHQVTKRNLKFRLYETDAGLHGYCTSKTFRHEDSRSWSRLQGMHCDEIYIAFSAFRGFSVRVSPKTYIRFIPLTGGELC